MAKKEVKKKVEKKATKAPLAKSSGKVSQKSSSAKAASAKSSTSKVASKKASADKSSSGSSKSSSAKGQTAAKAVISKVESKEKFQPPKVSSKGDTKSNLSKKEISPSVETSPSKGKAAKEIPKAVDNAANTEVAEPAVPSKKAKKYEAATEEEARWLELRDKYKSTKAAPYKMSEVYAEKTPIDHKVLGWGFIISVLNDRLEVLFQSGIKQLISNYKSNN